MTDERDSETRADGSDRREPAALALVLVGYALLVHRFWFVTDDAYISFRYARHFAAGHGLRFNLGDHAPVEGYSNFLWTVGAALVEWLGLSVELWPLVVSSVCGAVLVWRIHAVLRQRFALSWRFAVLGSAMFAWFTPVASHATTGLATMPYALLIFVIFERGVLGEGRRDIVFAGLAALTLSLIRVEGVLWAATMIPMIVIGRRESIPVRVRWIALYLGVLLAGYVPYFAWRIDFYGLLLPNTVYAKSGLSVVGLARGLDYVIAQWLTTLSPFLLIPAAIVLLRSQRPRTLIWPTVAMAFAFPAYAVLVTGDFMAMGRFLVPGWSFTALVVPVALADIAGSNRRRELAALAVGLLAIGVALAPAFDLHVVPESIRARFHFRHNTATYRSEFQQWRSQVDNARAWTTMGIALDESSPPGTSIVVGPVGAIGYFSDLEIWGRFGLVNREVTTRPVTDRGLRSPGHDREAPLRFFLQFEPDLIRPRLVTAEGVGQGESGRRSRAAFVADVRKFRASVRRSMPDVVRGYVLEARPISRDAGIGKRDYLLVWRRLQVGEDPATARRPTEHVLDELLRDAPG